MKKALALASGTQPYMLVTMRLGKQLFGISVEHVQDVLRQQRIVPIPLAPREVIGSLNVRGRIVTAIDLRLRLSLPIPEKDNPLFVVVEYAGQYYSLVVDSVGDILTLSSDEVEESPTNLPPDWRHIASGVCKMDDQLLVILNVGTLLDL